MVPGDDRIRRFYIFRAVTSFSLWIPFWTLWVYHNLESVFLLTVVDTAFWITMILFQVPAGLLGDKYGRRAVLFTGEALFAVGVLVFGLSTEFWQFMLSNIVWALGVCFIVSGDTPFVYDTLAEFGRQSEFIQIMATATVVMYMTNALACAVGGVIVELTDRFELTLIISSLVGLMGSFTVLALREPAVDRSKMASYLSHLGVGVRRILSSRAIMVLIFFQIVVEVGVYVMAVFRSIYMKVELALGHLEVGLLFSSFLIFGGMFATKAGKIEARLGEKRSLLFLYLSVFGSFAIVFLVRSPVAIVTQYPIYVVAALQAPIIMGYINKRVDSAHRSTVTALATFIFTAVLVVIEVASGWVATAWGLRESLLVLALASTPVALYLLGIWSREVDSSKLNVAGPGS